MITHKFALSTVFTLATCGASPLFAGCNDQPTVDQLKALRNDLRIDASAVVISIPDASLLPSLVLDAGVDASVDADVDAETTKKTR